MRNFKTLLICLAVIISSAAPSMAQHYYGGGHAIPLKVDSSKIAIKFIPGLSLQDMESLLADIDRIVGQLPDNHAIDDFVICSLSTGMGYIGFMDSVSELNTVYMVEPYYLNQFDSAFLVGTRFCVAFDEAMTLTEIEDINATFNVEIDHEIEGMPNVYVLRNTNLSGYGLLDLANTYYELDETRYSHPEFGVWIQKCSYKLYDYYSDYQPHTKKVIGTFNIASVWDFAGLTNQVNVAVIDDGVTIHEDLPDERVLTGYDFAGDSLYDEPDFDPTPGPGCAHGMGCAGIISASHSTDSLTGINPASGVISLNPATYIIPIKIFNDSGSAYGMSPSDVATAITAAYEGGADILSNSWGYGFPGSGEEYDELDILSEALGKAATLGRKGLGCPVIFASGNAGTIYNDVLYPAWLSCTYAVGTTELNDDRFYYSSYGSRLDIVAPSGLTDLNGDVWTLDQMDELGYNPNLISDCPTSGANDVDYDCGFGGTSAACPVVSGVASLILSKDPTLTAYEVYDILSNSAVKNLDWGTISDTPHVEYGYGRVDAFRAILSLARGDINNDNDIDMSDITALIDYLYLTHTHPFPSILLADCNCDGQIDISDITRIITFLYQNGPPPVKPCFVYELTSSPPAVK